MGAALTVRVKSAEDVAGVGDAPSLAVTRTVSAPMSDSAGVPLKSRSSVSTLSSPPSPAKVSHDGSAPYV